MSLIKRNFIGRGFERRCREFCKFGGRGVTINCPGGHIGLAIVSN